MDRAVIALLGLKGGGTKTTTAVGLTEYWGSEVTLIDVDNERITFKSASWLDKLAEVDNHPKHVTWIESTPGELSKALDRLDGTIIIDTAGKKTSDEMTALAQFADLVLLPGRKNELEPLSESFVMLKRNLDPLPKFGLVLGDVHPFANPDSATGVIAESARYMMSTSGVPLVGSIPHYEDLASAPMYGVRISDIPGNPGTQIEERFRSLVANVKDLING